ncbi:MAG: 3'-5' exonuclease [Flavobacteriales bacterium]|nr:3'-5' exonuclease [Flavobacteriales bacterium]
MLKLSKPLVFLDFETTGINVAKDRIVEYAFLKLLPNGNQESKVGRLNPTIPISMESMEIHGITNEDVQDCPTFKDMAKEFDAFLKDCDFAGYNSNKFDVPLLVEEFLRVDIDLKVENRRLVDVQNIFHKMEQRTLAAAFKFYCEKELVGAHNAEVDNLATHEILLAQIDRYEDLKGDVKFLHDFSIRRPNVDLAGRIVMNKDNEEIFNFGKHKGKKVFDVFSEEPGYYGWMLNGDFPLYTKKVLKELKEKSDLARLKSKFQAKT